MPLHCINQCRKSACGESPWLCSQACPDAVLLSTVWLSLNLPDLGLSLKSAGAVLCCAVLTVAVRESVIGTISFNLPSLLSDFTGHQASALAASTTCTD